MHLWWIAISIVGSSFFGTIIVESFVIQPTSLFFPLHQQQHHQQHVGHHGGKIGTLLSSTSQQNTNIVDEDIVTTKTKQRRTWEESYQLLVSYKENHGNCNVPQKYKDDSRLGLWVTTQRQRKDTLNDERIVKLDDLGFSWSQKQRAWEESYQLLLSYKEKNGNCNVPQNYKDDSRLGRWVVEQRRKKEKGSLSDERIVKLDDLGFSWSEQQRTWEEGYQLLLSYKEKNGNCNVPQKYKDDRRLGLWVTTQRQQKEKGSLSDERITKLDAVGFLWNKRSRTWDESFTMLVEFKRKNGHCNVPQRYEDDRHLGRWVMNQRRQKEKDSLSDERITKLDDLGFSWNFRSRTWDESFTMLVEFKTKHGHCSVPQRYKEDDRRLGLWVRDQRRRKDSLSDERITKLDDVGFSWSVFKEN